MMGNKTTSKWIVYIMIAAMALSTIAMGLSSLM